MTAKVSTAYLNFNLLDQLQIQWPRPFTYSQAPPKKLIKKDKPPMEYKSISKLIFLKSFSSEMLSLSSRDGCFDYYGQLVQ